MSYVITWLVLLQTFICFTKNRREHQTYILEYQVNHEQKNMYVLTKFTKRARNKNVRLAKCGKHTKTCCLRYPVPQFHNPVGCLAMSSDYSKGVGRNTLLGVLVVGVSPSY